MLSEYVSSTHNLNAVVLPWWQSANRTRTVRHAVRFWYTRCSVKAVGGRIILVLSSRYRSIW